MAEKKETGRAVMPRVAQPLTPARRAWGAVRDLRERVGCSGCAVGILGLAFSAYMVSGMLREALSYGEWPPAEAYCSPLFPLLVSAVALAFCWRHPSLSRIVLAVMLAVAGVFIMLAAVLSGTHF